MSFSDVADLLTSVVTFIRVVDIPNAIGAAQKAQVEVLGTAIPCRLMRGGFAKGRGRLRMEYEEMDELFVEPLDFSLTTEDVAIIGTTEYDITEIPEDLSSYNELWRIIVRRRT
ncbi:hypothetical protein C4588_07240 [Candidatus Parcubacteria bacterium]|nr:MAG: hypothetical protein C4588_07240 [Candidatus Parcubacteria bacterium]